MPNAEQLQPPRAAPAGAPTSGGVVESVVDFLLEHLDDVQRADVLRRIAPRGAASGRARSGARIACPGARGIKLVPLREVEFVRSSLAGVHAVTATGEFYTEQTLAALEADATFVRCHKQFLVNLDRIDEIDLARASAASIRTRSGFTVPVSRRYRQRLMAALQL